MCKCDCAWACGGLRRSSPQGRLRVVPELAARLGSPGPAASYVHVRARLGTDRAPHPPDLAMRMRGLEPPRGCPHTDLNRARLPIPPHPRGRTV
jgi:hypothetical protein